MTDAMTDATTDATTDVTMAVDYSVVEITIACGGLSFFSYSVAVATTVP